MHAGRATRARQRSDYTKAATGEATRARAPLWLRIIASPAQVGDGDGNKNRSHENARHQVFSVVFPLRLPAQLAEEVGDVAVRKIIQNPFHGNSLQAWDGLLV